MVTLVRIIIFSLENHKNTGFGRDVYMCVYILCNTRFLMVTSLNDISQRKVR